MVMNLRGVFFNCVEVAITVGLFSIQAADLHTEEQHGSVCLELSSVYKAEL